MTENTERIAKLSESNLTKHTINLTQQHFADPTKRTKTDLSYAQAAVLAAAAAKLNYSSSSEDLHMAEKLVECAAQQKKSAFQFDTITPKKTIANVSAIEASSSTTSGPNKMLTNSEYQYNNYPNDIDNITETIKQVLLK